MTTYYCQQKNGNEIITLETVQANSINEATKLFGEMARNSRKYGFKFENKINTRWTKIFVEGYQK